MIVERVARRLKLPIKPTDVVLSSISGQQIRPIGYVTGDVELNGHNIQSLTMLVLPSLPGRSSMLIGMDVVRKIGGLALVVKPSGQVSAEFGACAAEIRSVPCIAPITLIDADYRVHFDGQKWEVAWTWKDSVVPILQNHVAEYAMDQQLRDRYRAEVGKWIQNGWLQPCDEPEGGIIPLLAVYHDHKDKVRPVLDYRELNQYVQSHTAESKVCPETLRKWRLMGDKLGVIDLKDAYLQLHVQKELQAFQIVKFAGQYYRLTRVGFGLTSAPKIMSAIVSYVLAVCPRICAATDHYVDDIVVDTTQVSVEEVVQHLLRYGLLTKAPEKLCDASVLGLRLVDDGHGPLGWRRGKAVLPEGPLDSMLTRRELFSLTGRLVGHYPIAGWLRVACSFLKRHSNGSHWEDPVGERAMAILSQILRRVKEDDPVKGQWAVPPVSAGRVWCDASSLATGVLLDIDGVVAEDAAWLRKKSDAAHINVAELDAAIQGLNMAIRWQLKKINLITDSATVHNWLHSALSNSHKVRTHGMSEMLVKRRLSIVRELVAAYELEVTIQRVPSAQNKADILTRIPLSWLHERSSTLQTLTSNMVCATATKTIERLHQQHHFGIDRTLQLAHQVDDAITRQQVESVVRNCPQCCSIDPAPRRWRAGHLNVQECWHRVAIDVTHHGRVTYLSAIDCGPSRFTIWRRIPNEDAAVIMAVLESIIAEFGPPAQLLLDNSASFRSAQLRRFAEKWNVNLRFRCAYRPSGNGIVERIHRTIKRTAARSNSTIQEAVFWYNIAPLKNNDAASPSSMLFQSDRRWRNPNNAPDVSDEPIFDASFEVGVKVFVKPADARCSTPWPIGTVTAVISDTQIEVDGVPRHVADCRRVPESLTDAGQGSNDSTTEEESSSDEQDENDDTQSANSDPPLAVRRPRRQLVDPNRLIDRHW